MTQINVRVNKSVDKWNDETKEYSGCDVDFGTILDENFNKLEDALKFINIHVGDFELLDNILEDDVYRLGVQEDICGIESPNGKYLADYEVRINYVELTPIKIF